MDVGEIAVAVAAVAAVVTATAGAVSLGANAASHATDAISSAIIAVRRLAVSISSLIDALRSAPLPYNSTVDHALSRVQTGQGGQTSDDEGAGIHRSCGISEQAVVKHGKVVKESPARQTSESADSAAEKLDLVAVWPTDEQINKALVRVQYQEDCLHFAVSGQSCSGKSSLINALRGMKNRDPNAAKVGHTENTASVARYSGGEWFPRVAWYDVPGAGTRKIPASQYFNQQGLFLFDFIILVYDGVRTQVHTPYVLRVELTDIPLSELHGNRWQYP
jgi:ribosomal protein S5